MSVLSEAVAEELLRRAAKKANTRRKAEEKEARAAVREEVKAAKAAKKAATGPRLDIADDDANTGNTSKELAEPSDTAPAPHEITRSPNGGVGGDNNDDILTAADGLVLTSEEIEKIFAHHNIPSSPLRALPVPLRALRIQFSGVKVLPVTHQDAVGHDPLTDSELSALLGLDADQGADNEQPGDEDVEVTANGEPARDEDVKGDDDVPSAAVAFDWTWEPQPGVNGIGSGKNLRGKSTILNVLMWALSGRCAKFQPDVKSWIHGVQVDWQVGSEHLRVKFRNSDGHPEGTVELIAGNDGAPGKPVVLGEFAGEEQFEGVMGSVMMARLRLEEIPVWTVDRSVRHKWPAYASVFTVRADTLNPVVGNVNELGVRMLQMLIGTDWGPALAATSTALRGLESESAAAGEKASAASEVLAKARATAEAEVERLTAAFNAIPAGTPDVRDIMISAGVAIDQTRTLHELERQLLTASANVDTIKLQLRTAKARDHTVLEDKLAIRFFHQMNPSRCPRCSASVTAEQRAAEIEQHECSLCARDLDLDQIEVHDFGDNDAPVGDDAASPVNDVDALREALVGAERALEALAARITAEEEVLAAAEEANRTAQGHAAAAEERRDVELALARAQGALSAFGDASESTPGNTVDPTTFAVLTIAEKLLKEWMRDGQAPLLEAISRDVEALAVGFGADSLSNIRLDGSGVMRLVKHGKPVTYSGVTDGEKLRLKIATAVALIKHGSVAGVGRHPGFLVLDSPAAEEMPEEDLGVLVKALIAVAGEADMQIFVGTRNTPPLLGLLNEQSRVIAPGESYLW